MAATHVACTACGHFTEITAGKTAADTPCRRCPISAMLGDHRALLDGTPPPAVRAVAIIECPDGVTAEKAALGQVCADSDHDVSNGTHVVEVE